MLHTFENVDGLLVDCTGVDFRHLLDIDSTLAGRDDHRALRGESTGDVTDDTIQSRLTR